MKKFSPRTAKTLDQLCSLRSDNYSTPDHWILVSENYVCIHTQRSGESSTQEIRLPKATFNRMIAWYQRPTKDRQP